MEVIAISTLGIITLVSLLGNLYLVITIMSASIRKPKVKRKTKKK